MNDPKAILNRMIAEAIEPLTVNGVLPANAVLVVLDPVTGDWQHYATGGTAAWFARVIDEDAITEIYRGARLIGYCNTVLVELKWEGDHHAHHSPHARPL